LPTAHHVSLKHHQLSCWVLVLGRAVPLPLLPAESHTCILSERSSRCQRDQKNGETDLQCDVIAQATSFGSGNRHASPDTDAVQCIGHLNHALEGQENSPLGVEQLSEVEVGEGGG